MVKKITSFLLSSFLLFSCAQSTETPLASIVTVYATAAAQPWLTELFACANGQSVILNVTSFDPEIYLRVGEPETLVTPAYQVDEEELLIVTNRESSVQNLTLEEAQALFAGQGDPSAQVWVYASDVDVQILFDQLVMKGRSVSSPAKLAAGPQEMSDVLSPEPNSVGILTGHWKTGNVREIYSAGMVPILAITKIEPRNEVKTLLGCLQSN